jgi:cytochrome P450 PksS
LSSQRVEIMVRAQLRGLDPAATKDYERIARTQMLFRDGAEHHRLRVLGNRGFTPSMLEIARPKIQATVDGLLDRVQSRGQMDVVAEFAQPLPALVIAELFGVPERDRAQFQKWSDDAATLTGVTQGNPANEAQAANEGMRNLEAYFLEVLAERRQHPGDDLVSLLLAGQAEGRLSAEEVCSQCILILIAGHVTTVDQLANGVQAFLTHPRQWQRLCHEPALIHSAVEEVLRVDPSVSFIHRISHAATRVGDREFEPGQFLWRSVAAATRDPAAFPEPHCFDTARAGGPHLTVGAGQHVCLGAGLARRELQIALATLSRRMPNLRPGDDPPRRNCASLAFRGFHWLPVLFR